MSVRYDHKQLVVAIEAGGTKCSVHLAGVESVLVSAVGGPCNLSVGTSTSTPLPKQPANAVCVVLHLDWREHWHG